MINKRRVNRRIKHNRGTGGFFSGKRKTEQGKACSGVKNRTMKLFRAARRNRAKRRQRQPTAANAFTGDQVR